MAQVGGKRFESPDEVREFTEGKGRVELVDLTGMLLAAGRLSRVGAGLRT
jgi:hypothetical protein